MNLRSGEMEKLKQPRASADTNGHGSLTNKTTPFAIPKSASLWAETELSVQAGSQDPEQAEPKAAPLSGLSNFSQSSRKMHLSVHPHHL